jgi:hypothetical protein
MPLINPTFYQTIPFYQIAKYISIYWICTLKITEMGKIIIALEDDLEKRFREEVFRRHGMKKGNLSNAISNAIELWLKTR